MASQEEEQQELNEREQEEQMERENLIKKEREIVEQQAMTLKYGSMPGQS